MENRVLHQMRLLRMHFEKVASGEKTVEMRLMDEKRKRIAAGDLILFTCEEEPSRCVTVEVIGVRRFDDFEALAESLGARAVGFAGKDARFVGAYMREIYGDAAIRAYGAAAIEIRLLAQ